MIQSRQEGYYWCRYIGSVFFIAFWDNDDNCWYSAGSDNKYQDSDFEHINEVRIKNPGELPD